MRENEKPTRLTRRHILASGVAMTGMMPFLPIARAAAAPEPRTAKLRLTADTRTLGVNANRRKYSALAGRTENPVSRSRPASTFTSIS
jgi:hypothetical protein